MSPVITPCPGAALRILLHLQGFQALRPRVAAEVHNHLAEAVVEVHSHPAEAAVEVHAAVGRNKHTNGD